MDEERLQRQLAAAHRTIATLMRRVEDRVASGATAFAVLEQTIALERVVREKTRQLQEQQRQLELALRELAVAQSERMQAQKLESVGRLAAGIAHEINTPIQFVTDSVRFVQDAIGDLLALVERYRDLRAAAGAGPVPPEQLQALDEAEAEADLPYLAANVPPALARSVEGLARVAGIVRSMKEFANPGQTEKALTDLNRALATTLTIARNEYKYVADVETDYGPLPLVTCQVSELNQVFLNLVVNAAHAIAEARGPQGGKGLIRITTRAEGDVVVIAVSDDGTGIADGIRDRIFDPFFTTKEVGKGAGQGLSVARSVVVDKHGGSLTYESEVGKGTTFYVRLPVGPAPAEPPPAARAPAGAARGETA